MLCFLSGEAEFNGGVAACSEGLFMKEVFSFLASRSRWRCAWTAARPEEFSSGKVRLRRASGGLTGS